MKLIQETILYHKLGLEIIQLCNAKRSSFSDVWIVIFQGALERIAQIVYDFICAETPHRSNRQCTYEWVRILGVLDEGVHGQNDEFRLCLCIVHEIEIHELLLFEIFCLHVLEDVGEQAANV